MTTTSAVSEQHHRMFAWSEVLLTLVTATAALAFGRLFTSSSFLPPVLVAVVGSHAIAAVTRRRGWSLPRSALLSALCLLLAITWLEFAHTTAFGLPTTATLDALRTEASSAWTIFKQTVPPTDAVPGFVIAIMIAFWIAAFLADWAAFRLWSGTEAIVPPAALFVFTAILGTSRHPVLSTTLFIGVVLVFELVHRVTRITAHRGWIETNATPAGSAMISSGVLLAVCALVLGAIAGPLFPGAKADPLVNWRGGGAGQGSRLTLSPLVDIRSRLVDQADTEVFTVRSNQRAYWRLTSLDTFDGTIWRSKGEYQNVKTNLPADTAAPSESTTVEQQYTIEALDALWLPAAFEPRSVRTDGFPAIYEPASSTLIVGGDLQNSDNSSYQVSSVLPRFDAAELRDASGSIPSDVAAHDLQLPSDITPEISRTARAVTTGASTPYDQALALEQWFRDNFTYDLTVGAGHTISDIDDFLRTRRGYCEQFAGTYAAMARSLGIPSRVAVGFTPGEVDARDPTLYHVLGRYAHAWPEVYLGSAGWVPFEPTPGRGEPGAEAWTRVREQQTGGSPAPSTDSSTTALSPTTSIATSATTTPSQAGRDVTTSAQRRASSATPLWLRAVRLLSIVAGLVVAYVLGVVLAKAVVARRRRRQAVDNRDRALLAWQEGTDHLAAAGIVPAPAETHDEFVERARVATDIEGTVLDILATAAREAAYSSVPPTDTTVSAAEEAAREVGRQVAVTTSVADRWRHQLDPRPLVPRRRSRQITHLGDG
jgi:transglutaminase-like putative cysteine protease